MVRPKIPGINLQPAAKPLEAGKAGIEKKRATGQGSSFEKDSL
jgi:hypothetical protein